MSRPVRLNKTFDGSISWSRLLLEGGSTAEAGRKNRDRQRQLSAALKAKRVAGAGLEPGEWRRRLEVQQSGRRVEHRGADVAARPRRSHRRKDTAGQRGAHRGSKAKPGAGGSQAVAASRGHTGRRWRWRAAGSAWPQQRRPAARRSDVARGGPRLGPEEVMAARSKAKRRRGQ